MKVLFEQTEGGSFIECICVLPLLLLLLFGVIQFGLIMSAKLSLLNASMVAARYATLTPAPTPSAQDVKDIAREAVKPFLKVQYLRDPDVNMNATVGGASGAKSVNLTYDLPLLVPMVFPGKSSVTIHAGTTMR